MSILFSTLSTTTISGKYYFQYQMSCVLSFIGQDLDVDALDGKSGLGNGRKTYKGQPRFKTQPEGEKMPYSVLSFVVSNAGFDDFNQQVEDVIEYLRTHYQQMTLLAATKGIEFANLSFGVNYQDKFVQSHSLTPELVKLAGELGLSIEVCVYTSGEK